MFTPWYKWAPHSARPYLQVLTRAFARMIAYSSGMKVTSNYKTHSKGTLMVSNHLSYLDIFAILTQLPACFITSNELKETPLLGHVCRLSGCIFVERRSRSELYKDIKTVSTSLEAGYDVFLFPEGGTSSGEGVKKFKRPLFKGAMDADKDITLFAVNYKSINGEPVSIENRDLLAWYDDMTFLPHFCKLICQKSFEIEINMVGVLKPQHFEDVTQLAIEAHRIISHNYHSIG